MSRSEPRYSILVVAFNVDATIGRCLDSIVSAKNEYAVELIVVDDGSTDQTAEICTQYAQRFGWIRVISQPNAGVAEARNRALREATGEYVAFVDSDDTIEPHYFDFIDGKLRETAADMLVFGHNRMQLDGVVYSRPNVRADLGRNEIAQMQLHVANYANIYMLCWARMFRKELASGFVFDRRITLGEDSAFDIHTINQADRVVVYPDCLYNYFESAGSLSSGTYKVALLESFEAHYAARLRVHHWPQAGSFDSFALRRSIALSYVEYVLQYLLNNIRLMPLSEQFGELKRIRRSVIYQECIPHYAGRSRYRGVRFLVTNFVRERYLAVMAGVWLAGFLTNFRVFIIPSMLWRQQGMERGRARPDGLGVSIKVDSVDVHARVSGVHWIRRFWQEMSESHFVRNVASVATGIAAAQAIQFAFMPFLTRLYSPEAFGALAAFTAVIGIITPLATLGYANAIVMPDTDDGATAVARLSLVCAAVVAPLSFALIFLFQPQLAALTGLEASPSYLYLIPIALLLMALLAVANQVAIREGLFKAKARSYVASTLLTNMGKLMGGLLAPSGFLLIVFSQVNNALNYSMLLARVPRKGAFQVRRWFGIAGIREAARGHRDFALYRMPHSVINAASLSLPVIMLTSLYGAAAAGQYSISMLALGAPVTLLGQSVFEVFYPRITRAIQRQPESAGAIIAQTTRGLVLLSLLPFGAIALYGDWIFPFVFGADWARAGEFSQWVALWMASSLATRPAVAAIPALRKQVSLLVYEIIMTVARMSALYVGYRVGDDLTSIMLFSVTNVVGYIALLLLVFASVARYQETHDA